MSMLIKTPSQFATPQVESSKPSEMAMYFEMAIALAACVGLLAVPALVWYLANPDWISSIRRFQEMI